MTVTERVKAFVSSVPDTNPYGEKITLLAAVKTRTPEEINEAIRAGISAIGDNHAQEFRDNYDRIEGNPERHFIGTVQSNKIKYILGRADLIQSVDRIPLARELSDRSAARGITTDILIEINAGGEDTKGGFTLEGAKAAYNEIRNMDGIRVRGIMAMLPESDDKEYLLGLAKSVRAVYDSLRETDGDIVTLSMGMSGDWETCVEAGSNMIRIGTALFGPRNHSV